MSDLKPGDEVAYVGLPAGTVRRPDHVKGHRLSQGQTHTILHVAPWKDSDLFAVILEDFPSVWFDARCFRKVQKRNDRLTVEAFSVIKDGEPEEPKRVPEKTKEKRNA